MPGKDAWVGQKKLLTRDIPSHDFMVMRISRVPLSWPRFIGALLYLTAARAGEITTSKEDSFPRIDAEDINGHPCLKFLLRNEKNRKQKLKILPVRIGDDPELSKIIIDSKDLIGFLPKSRQAVHRLTVRAFGWNPHYFRHVRLTHLAVDKKWSDTKLSRWAGWSDARPATTYVKYKYTDFVED